MEDVVEWCRDVYHPALLPVLCGRLLLRPQLLDMSEDAKYMTMHAAAAALANACHRGDDFTPFQAAGALLDAMLTLLGVECEYVTRTPAYCVSSCALVKELGVYEAEHVRNVMLLPRASFLENKENNLFLPIFLCLVLAASASPLTRELYADEVDKLSLDMQEDKNNDGCGDYEEQEDDEAGGNGIVPVQRRLQVLFSLLEKQCAGEVVQRALAQQIAYAAEYPVFYSRTFNERKLRVLVRDVDDGLHMLVKALVARILPSTADHQLPSADLLGAMLWTQLTPGCDMLERHCHTRYLAVVRAFKLRQHQHNSDDDKNNDQDDQEDDDDEDALEEEAVQPPPTKRSRV